LAKRELKHRITEKEKVYKPRRAARDAVRWWHTAATVRGHKTTLEGNANRWAHATVALHVGPSCAARQIPQLKPSRG
jgi:hypothetical protein